MQNIIKIPQDFTKLGRYTHLSFRRAGAWASRSRRRRCAESQAAASRRSRPCRGPRRSARCTCCSAPSPRRPASSVASWCRRQPKKMHLLYAVTNHNGRRGFQYWNVKMFLIISIRIWNTARGWMFTVMWRSTNYSKAFLCPILNAKLKLWKKVSPISNQYTKLIAY